MEPRSGIEPNSEVYKTSASPTMLSGHLSSLPAELSRQLRPVRESNPSTTDRQSVGLPSSLTEQKMGGVESCLHSPPPQDSPQLSPFRILS